MVGTNWRKVFRDMGFLPAFLFALIVAAGADRGKIINGVYAKEGQFSYVAAVRNGTQGVICGGAILGSNWVLTAAHCKNAAYVSVGGNQLDQQCTFKIDRKVVHPDYDPRTLQNDIMLLRVNKSLPMYYYSNGMYEVTSIPWNYDQQIDQNTSLTLTLAGWGQYSPNSPISPNLLYANYTLMNQTSCLVKNSGSNSKTPYNPDTQLCGQMPPVDSPTGAGFCSADGGGPLVWDDRVIGVASRIMNKPCGSGYPDVFTRVSAYGNWINGAIYYGSQ